MTVRRTAARTLGVVALVAPLASVGLATAPVASAATASSFTSPAAGAAFTGEQQAVQVSASVPACAKNALGNCSSTPTTTLTVTSNGVTFSATPKKWGTSAGSITATVEATAGNGTWNANLSDGGAATSRSFTLDFDTSTPMAFRTQTTNGDAQDVAFYWAKNPETDLSTYVLTENGATLFSGGSSAAGCTSSSTCSTSFAYSSSSPGQHAYALVARRPGASGSPHSSSAAGTTATLTAPPKPTPSPTASPSSPPAAGGSTTGGTTGSSTTGGSSTSGGGSSSTSGGGSSSSGGGSSSTSGGGSASNTGTSTGGASSPKPSPTSAIPVLSSPVVQQRRAFALTFNSFSPALGIPKLPPLPSTDDAVVGAEPKLADGTFTGTLPYKPQTETTKTITASSDSRTFVTNVLDSAQIAKSIAAALILMLAFGHLRRFLASHVED